MSNIIHCGKYDVFVGNDTFLRLGKFVGHRRLRPFILVDENTRQHCLPLLQERVLALKDADVLEIPAGEKHKSTATCEYIWEQLTRIQAGRQSLLVNLGGGMVCDTGGFAASVFLRGIDFIHLPTTLLSMVDSSVGGKTGVNFAGLKNQLGTFTRPAAVFISPVWLRTLPSREIQSGFAEVIKHALISSRTQWEELRRIGTFDNIDWLHVIRESVFLKNRIVNADFRDRNQRKALNFGHTIGHALESFSLEQDPDPLRHGEAIALGMLGELFLSRHLLGFPEEEVSMVSDYILRHFPLVTASFNSAEVWRRMLSDKKNDLGSVRFALLRDIGKPVIHQEAAEGLTLQALEFIMEKTGKAALHP